MITKIDTFTATGTWTVPSNVTYAIATIRGAGGGSGSSYSGAATPGAGGSSSVAFASGTVTAAGGNALNLSDLNQYFRGYAGSANGGQGSSFHGHYSGISGYNIGGTAEDGVLITAGATVTPNASITVTVGAGGTAGGNGFAGGSGYVYIQYQVPA
jgi:hypothetical protein